MEPTSRLLRVLSQAQSLARDFKVPYGTDVVLVALLMEDEGPHLGILERLDSFAYDFGSARSDLVQEALNVLANRYGSGEIIEGEIVHDQLLLTGAVIEGDVVEGELL